MLKIEIIGLKCETDIRGDKLECISEMIIAFDKFIEVTAKTIGHGMTYEEAKQMLCEGVDKAHEVKMRDGE